MGQFGAPTLRDGVLAGESTIRELAAFLLDSDNFSGVPETALALVNHQTFAEHDCLPVVIDLLTNHKSASEPICALEIKKDGNFRRIQSNQSITGLTDKLTTCSSTYSGSCLLSVSPDSIPSELCDVKTTNAKLGTL